MLWIVDDPSKTFIFYVKPTGHSLKIALPQNIRLCKGLTKLTFSEYTMDFQFTLLKTCHLKRLKNQYGNYIFHEKSSSNHNGIFKIEFENNRISISKSFWLLKSYKVPKILIYFCLNKTRQIFQRIFTIFFSIVFEFVW